MSGLPAKQLEELKVFVEICKSNPDMLHHTELSFFKRWLESMGAKVPPKTEKTAPKHEAKKEPESAPEPEPEPESEESDLELDTEGVIDDADDFMPEYPDMDVEITEEMEDQANSKKVEAITALNDGELNTAVDLFTEAIKLNPRQAAFYAKRAQAYISMKKLKAAIHDCDKATDLNPNSALGFKLRGKARKMLGQWEESYKDLGKACQIDFDDDANEMMKQVKPNALKIQEHNRKYQRKREEKELRDRKERVRKAKEAQEKARQESTSSGEGPGGFPGGMPGGFPGGMPGGFAGGFPGCPGGGSGGGAGMPDLTQLLSDPDILQAFQDPEIAAAFSDVSHNPANISKYQDNPRVQKVIEKITKKFGFAASGGESSGSPGEGPGGMGGVGGAPPRQPSNMDVD